MTWSGRFKVAKVEDGSTVHATAEPDDVQGSDGVQEVTLIIQYNAGSPNIPQPGAIMNASGSLAAQHRA